MSNQSEYTDRDRLEWWLLKLCRECPWFKILPKGELIIGFTLSGTLYIAKLIVSDRPPYMESIKLDESGEVTSHLPDKIWSVSLLSP